ncbi:MAG: hypothetical protein HY751_08185 [Nitrospinae bacterium]|nr:hypothetical protein [Nitrospinota bacterium]
MSDPFRRAAFEILRKSESSKTPLDILLTEWRAKKKHEERDRAFVFELTLGVTRWKMSLDYIIGKFSDRPVEKLGTAPLILLRMGVYQLASMDKVPPYAAVNEMVNLAKSNPDTRKAAGYVNAILRNLIRRVKLGSPRPSIAEIVKSLSGGKTTPAGLLAEAYSFPAWLCNRWVDRFGKQMAESVIAASNEQAPVFFRMNPLKAPEADNEKLMGRWGISAEKFPLAPWGYRLTSGKITPGLGLFDEGYAQPQDGSSMIAASLLEIKPGQVVADICCGKGIKSGFFAARMENRGLIFSMDSSTRKFSAFAENMARQGITICHPVVADAAEHWPLKKPAQAVFIDAPCSATGVFRRHPEGKWNKTPATVERMAELQGRMLDSAVKSLAPGGALVYAVCSIEPEEGVDQVERLIASNPAITRDDIKSGRPELEPFITDQGDLFILPGQGGMDGFFATRLVKAL